MTMCWCVGAAAEKSGSCGENLTWVLDDEGVLTISGTGEMNNYSYSEKSPWYDDRDSIATVQIENGVTGIGDFAFWGCYKLKTMTIPDKVTRIGINAFLLCTNMESVTFGNGVTRIDENAFYGCGGLTRVDIPASVSSMEGNVFQSCEGLTSINVSEQNANYCSAEGILFSKDKTVLIAYPAGRNSSSYTIPNGVIEIGNRAFHFCLQLMSITIPDSVEKYHVVSSGLFEECRNLENIYVSDQNAFLSAENGVLFNKDKTIILAYPAAKKDEYYTIPDSVRVIETEAFGHGHNLTNINIPDSVISIGYRAFIYCDKCTSITIGKNVSSLGSFAFAYCNSLRSVLIPKSLTAISSFAFDGCRQLETVYYSGTPEDWSNLSMESFNDALLNATVHYLGTNGLILPSALTTIESGAFANLKNINTVYIPTTVTSIAEDAFSGSEISIITPAGSYAERWAGEHQIPVVQ